MDRILPDLLGVGGDQPVSDTYHRYTFGAMPDSVDGKVCTECRFVAYAYQTVCPKCQIDLPAVATDEQSQALASVSVQKKASH